VSIVTEEDIAQIVAAWTGIPVNKMTRSESEKLLQMEELYMVELLVKMKL